MSRIHIHIPAVNVSLCCMLFLLIFFDSAQAAVAIKLSPEKEKVVLYSGSYALLIGASEYTAGWPSLESVPGELDKVAAMLERKNFTVERVDNPDAKQLQNAFTNFINRHGYDPGNRLLFFYSGHGYTRKNGKKGYLVPVDAPDPDEDEKGFLTKAMGMNHILSWSRDIEAKHVLFLFDSCFSGTIFKLRDRPEPPKHITNLTAQPVRQFITAGRAGESVPANSTFTPMFIDAILFGIGDLNGDGYVSGTELGMYLQEKVPLHANQNPQFGKIQDYDLSRGDFIFVAGEPVAESRGHTTDQHSPEKKGKTFKDPVTGMEFVWVEGGCYKMGQTAKERKKIIAKIGVKKHRKLFKDELPAHEVCLDGYWMGKYEVTQGQWEKIMGNNPSHFKSGPDYPVEHVSWNDAQEFIKKLNKESDRSFRLPTEAEWEYAARGKHHFEQFAGGSTVSEVAWFKANSDMKTHQVGTKKPNSLGLHDMSGNVWEWCADWYDGMYYTSSPRKNPQGPQSGKDRVGRGGSWGDIPAYVRTSYRDWSHPDKKDSYLGFRLVSPEK